MMVTTQKTPSEVDAMRESGRMLALVLDFLKKRAKEGISTKELADDAARELAKLGGEPAFLGYQGFPDVVCVSINDEVVHGIPQPTKIINEGDIVSLDFGVLYKGMITDGAVSIIVGKADPKDLDLVQFTEKSMYAGIFTLHDKIKTGDIGNAIETLLTKRHYGVVRDLVGHGVGHNLHEEPDIPNYGRKGTGKTLSTGMTIAIEPMATRGDHQVYLANDGWTILTRDGSRAAHFEHTILITQNGSEILTKL